MVPAALRSEGLDDTADSEDDQRGPRLGALSLSAVLAIALAALRGTVTVVSDWRQRRQERAAEEAVWREARVKRRAAEEDARARLAKVPTSAEFGRKAVQDGRKGAGLASGPGKGGRPGGPSGASGAGGSGRKTGPDQSRPKTGPSKTGPTKTSGPDASKSGSSGKTGPGPSGPKNTGPGKPSAGVLAPGKGKSGSSGGGGRGALDRIRDRKSPGPASGNSKPGGPGNGKGGGPKGSGTGPKSKANGPGTGPAGTKGPGGGKGPGSGAIGPNRKDGGIGPSTPGKNPGRRSSTGAGKTGPGTGPTTANGPTPGKTGKSRGRKVPGIKHGTHDGYDVHGCCCRRCRRMANGRRRPRPNPPGFTTGPGTPPPGGTPPPPRRGRRRSPDEDLNAATAWTETVITVERVDRPGDAERRPQPAAPAAVTTGTRSLPRAPHQPAGDRPGTTATTKKEPPMTVPAQATPRVPSAPPGVSPEHLTEVTLDDVLDHLAGSKTRCFTTFDACAVLADHARKLRREFDELAADLAEHHNIIGTLTSAASDHFAEKMAVVARKAEEMRTESLTAAEKVETAHDAMADAYRPVQEATADAGLVMPSARAHNED